LRADGDIFIVSQTKSERRFPVEPRQEVLKQEPETRKDERKSRFQIIKLEERIAPHCSHVNPHGKVVGHDTSRTC